MGNAGGFSSTVPSQSEQNQERQGSYNDLTDSQLQELGRALEVSKTEMQLLWRRFCVLGPDGAGVLDRGVFRKPPYSEDIFCRQIWKRFTGSKGAPHRISFESFARSMTWWQKAPNNHKLQLLFSWMTDIDGITPPVLSKILKHVLPDYQEDELRQIAEKMVTEISSSPDPTEVKEEEFQQWICQLPEEELRDALHFKILHNDMGTTL